MSKTDIELIKTTIIIPAGRSGRNDVMIPLYDANQLLTCMRAAREDEKEKIKEMIQNRIYELRFIIDHDQFKSPYYGEMLITELKKLIPCT